MKHLLLGDEAIAQGAIDAGLSGVYAYPGTPSTEITEYIQLSEKRKGGTTFAGLCKMTEGNFEKIMENTINASLDRTYEFESMF